MNNKNYIGKLSDLLKIPSSTLRYWESQSIIEFPRDTNNNYRSSTLKTLLNIWYIAFYRELSIPVKEIKKISYMDINELESTLTDNKKKLTEELHKLKKTIEKIELQEKNIEEVKYLKSNPCCIEKRAFLPIKLLNYSNDCFDDEMFDLTYFNIDNDEFWTIIDKNKSITDYCAFTSEPSNNIFREKDICEKLYLKGLLKFDMYDINNNNSNELILAAEKLGYKANTIIGKYLISAHDDIRYDYYEAWVELL